MEIVITYKPSEKELREIEESWLKDFQENKESLQKWFMNRLEKRIVDFDKTNNDSNKSQSCD